MADIFLHDSDRNAGSITLDDTTAQAGGGGQVALNQASETDSAQALTPSKALVLAQVLDSESAQQFGKAKSIGQAVEIDTVGSIDRAIIVSLGQAVESEVARTVKYKGPPLFRANSSTVDSTLSYTSPASTQVGDLVLVFTLQKFTGTLSPLTKHSSMDDVLLNDVSADGTGNIALGIAYKIATQAGAQTYQGFTSSQSSASMLGGVRVYQAGTFHANKMSSAFATDTGTSPPDAPESTELESSVDYKVILFGGWRFGSSVSASPGFPAGYVNTSSYGSGFDAEIGVGDISVTGVASVNPDPFTDNVTPTCTLAATIAIPGRNTILWRATDVESSTDPSLGALIRKKSRTLGQPTDMESALSITISGQFIALGQAQDAESSLAVASLKLKALGLSNDSEAAQSFTVTQDGGQDITFNQVLEANTSFSFTKLKAKAIGQPTETEASQPFVERKAKIIGQVSETNEARPFTERKAKAIVQVSETNEARSFTERKAKVIGQISETNEARPFTERKAKVIGQVSEIGIAQNIGLPGNQNVSLEQVTEVNSALPITRTKNRVTGLTSDQNAAQTFGKSKVHAIGLATEADTVNTITVLSDKTISIGQSIEINTALSLATKKTLTLGLTIDTSLSQSINKVKSNLIGLVTEIDQAHPLSLSFDFIPSEDRALVLSESARLYQLDEETLALISATAHRSLTSAEQARILANIELNRFLRS